MISPYLQRNLNLFNTITLTKSFGYNLLKGNNPNLKVEGDAVFVENKYPRKNLKIQTNNQYEINLDNFYRDEAIKNIKNKPSLYIEFYFIKVASFLFFDLNSSYPNYYNFFHIFQNNFIYYEFYWSDNFNSKKRVFSILIIVLFFKYIFIFFFFILPGTV